VVAHSLKSLGWNWRGGLTVERLTRRMCGGWGVVPGYELNTIKGMRAVIDRLAAYEDTMPLERARELAQAEKDGRLMVLPVKEGVTIYRLRLNFDGDRYEIIEKDFNLAYFRPEDFGRIIFRTREEADAALKKKEADNEAD